MMEQTEIARRIGVSNKSFRRIMSDAKLDNEKYFKLIDNKRHYDYDFIVKILQGIHGK